MHIPDGFLDARTALATGALGATGLAVALAEVRRSLPPRRVPLVGLAAAFVFAAQMLNFPVAAGTSGHLIGATLVVVLLGPGAAVLVMTAVLALQCLVFADGGVTALGANVFNMALVAPLVSALVYAPLRRLGGGGLRARLFATAFAAWCSTVAAAVSCAGQLAMSGTADWRAAFPAMAGIHMVIGLGEAVITTLVVAAVARARPELLPGNAEPEARPGYAGLAAQGLVVALGLALFVAPFASGSPDGLERVARALGFARHAAREPALAVPLRGYAVPGLGAVAASTVMAGAAGVVVAFGLAWILAFALTPRRARGAVPDRREDAPRASRPS